MLLRILTALFLISLLVQSDNNSPCFVRIYSNQAEIIQPLNKLPLEFTDDDWNDIRSDSVTLLGQDVNITSQTITEKQRSFNGAEIYIRSPMSFDQSIMNLVKGILIDERSNLVKIEDISIADQQALYFTVSSDQIFYLQQPSKTQFYVNFTYNTSDSQVSVSYLRSNLNWHTQYQLNLKNDASVLIAMANIRNSGQSSISIDRAELIGGDVNLHGREVSTKAQLTSMSYHIDRFATDENFGNIEMSVPIIEQANELAGLYVFPIDKPFVIDAKTNYLLPMFRPHVTVDRYGLISKSFSTTLNGGKAQRSYRLISDRFLSRGNCIIREFDRIVGEIPLPDIAAKNKYDFSIGHDADIVYKENVTLISSTTFTEEVREKNARQNSVSEAQTYTRTQAVYEINVQLKNFKTRSILLEYEQKGFYDYESVKLIMSNNHQFNQDGSSIRSNMTLLANSDQVYSYSIELLHQKRSLVFKSSDVLQNM